MQNMKYYHNTNLFVTFRQVENGKFVHLKLFLLEIWIFLDESAILWDNVVLELSSKGTNEAPKKIGIKRTNRRRDAVIIAVYNRDALRFCFLTRAGFSASLFFGR